MIETGNKRQETRGRSACCAHFRAMALSFTSLMVVVLYSLVSLLVFSLPVLAAAPEKILVEVARTAEVSSPVIYLGEIAKITAPDFFKDELTRIDLGKSPRAGRMKQLSGARVTGNHKCHGA